MNLAIARKGKNTIQYFIRDCLRRGSDYIGDRKIIGLKPHLYDLKWTEDDVVETIEPTTGQITYNKLMTDLATTSNTIPELDTVNNIDINTFYKQLISIAQMSLSDVENHVDNTFSQLTAQQRNSLTLLYKAVLGLIKLELRKIR